MNTTIIMDIRTYKLRKFVLIAMAISAAIFVVANYNFFKENFLLTFNKNGIITNYLSNSEKECTVITNGKIERKVYFRNNFKTAILNFYPNGKFKNKVYFKLNNNDGFESGFYETGALKYTASLKSGKRFGSLKWYSEKGKLESYAVFDIKGESFCLFEYNQKAVISKMSGLVVSPNIYSKDKKDSITLLSFNKMYNDIKDLFVVVATPPELRMQVKILINDKVLYNNSSVKNNLIVVPDAFKAKGNYKIFVESHLLDDQNKIINGINIEQHIIKE